MILENFIEKTKNLNKKSEICFHNGRETIFPDDFEIRENEFGFLICFKDPQKNKKI